MVDLERFYCTSNQISPAEVQLHTNTHAQYTHTNTEIQTDTLTYWHTDTKWWVDFPKTKQKSYGIGRGWSVQVVSMEGFTVFVSMIQFLAYNWVKLGQILYILHTDTHSHTHTHTHTNTPRTHTHTHTHSVWPIHRVFYSVLTLPHPKAFRHKSLPSRYNSV